MITNKVTHHPQPITSIAEVLLPVPLDKLFDYRIPESMTAIVGQRVWVEFGKQRHVGIIAHIRHETTEEPQTKLKTLIELLDEQPLVNEQWWKLLKFAARYYVEPLGKAFKNALPQALRQPTPVKIPVQLVLVLTELGQDTLSKQLLPKHATRQQKLLQLLLQAANNRCSETMLRQQKITPKDWNAASKKGWIEKTYSSPFNEDQAVQSAHYPLNAEQKQTINAIDKNLTNYQLHLLYGITGSGKTEVYMSLIEKALTAGKQVLMMVPEISLTPQLLSRFNQRFGKRISAYHSGMSDTSRRDTFLSAACGDLPILIGTRSSIFVPMANLGLILIDEEHDISYKQHDGFLYHAKDLAIYRAQLHNIPVILGSATPSLESLHLVKTNRATYHHLSQRATTSTLPSMQMVDRRGDTTGNVLDSRVIKAMRKALANDEQVLLFLNRRGFAPVMICNDCQWRSQCPNCSVYQTAHVSSRQLCCHHCGHTKTLPVSCPLCDSNHLFFAGAGTEKLESELNQQFPKHRILRLDRDKQATTKRLNQALADIHEGHIDIIVGTQLVVKGHHFPKVSTVCVVNADSALFSSDFRAEEKLIQQLTQVAGRAGRESHTGKVYIQSLSPAHSVFKALLKNDYWQHANQLLQEREDFQLPPYQATVLLKSSATDQTILFKFLRSVKNTITKHSDDLTVLGPVSHAIEKVGNRFYGQLRISAPNKSQLQRNIPLLNYTIQHFDTTQRYRSILDVDPLNS